MKPSITQSGTPYLISKQSTRKLFLLAFVFFSFAASAFATHFRYGNISWRSAGGNSIQFQISEAFRRTFFFSTVPAIGTVVNTGTIYFGDGTTAATSITITSVNIAEDWFFGTQTITHTYPNSGNFTAYTSNCCRISELENNNDMDYRIQTIVQPGSGNNSPVSTIIPIIDLPTNNSAVTFQVSAIDPEGSPLSYRLATALEASGFSSGFVHPAGLSINATTGLITFTTVGKPAGNLYTTQVIISDGSTQTAVDFIIRITGASTVTENPPVFDYGTTPPNGTVLSVAPGNNVNFTVSARDVDPGNTVSIVAAGVPVGATFTPPLPATGNPVTSQFNWTPALANLGGQVIQFQATDNTGRSVATSVTINVTQSCVISASAVTTPATTGNMDGTVTITGSGGTAPYTYTVQGVSNTTGIFSDLAAGSYTYTVTDSKNCGFTGGFVINQPDGPGASACPNDTIIIADPGTCKATVSWKAPSAMFPDSINITNAGKLWFKGMNNGHGYYESDSTYLWNDAKTISSGLGGHLLTINSAAENAFISSSIPVSNRFLWIGLYNTGITGNFAWVTGEPVTYTNWTAGEPNNLYKELTGPIFEPYVHINGYFPNNGWNDKSDESSQFIAEFEGAIITYKQIEGPMNGSSVSPGVYKICFERTNTASGISDTCCFTVTVVCNASPLDCQKDTTIMADPATCMATADWTEPTAMFPGSITINQGSGKLWFKGIHNGHGYYESDNKYFWNDARTISSDLGGHLLTINSADENAFIKSNIPVEDRFSWIGLYNTGTVGSFAWVTGEPITFTNWLAGEPDNFYGVPSSTVYERYVQINGYFPNNVWDDRIDGDASFIAEFESGLLTYKQISGPVKGSSVMPGVYTICYEKTNTATGEKDTCCFLLTVVCHSMTAAQSSDRSTTISGNINSTDFEVVGFPNPTTSTLSLKISSSNTTRVNLQVTDIVGRIVEVKTGIAPNNLLKLGNNYKPGIYFISIIQGKKKITLKMIKQ